MGSDYQQLLLHTEVRWLSMGRALKRFIELKNEIISPILRNLRVKRRGLRDMSNPFELPDETFKKLFRLPKDLVQTLFNGIEQSLAHPDGCTGIPQYLMICDSQLKILNVDARFPGSAHDAAIWSVSNIKEHMEECYRNGDRGNYLLGDSGYPLQPWLLTPVNAAEDNSPEAAYNKMYCSIRNVVERLNRVLKQRFRCLLRHRVLHYSPLKAGKIL
ncbi:uncharacterized protein CBL_20150 [Carabus blaptoides fortunei]